MSKAIVIFSGGQDSTLCLGLALTKFDKVKCLTFNYGQRHKIELAAARRVVSFYMSKVKRGIEHEVVAIGPEFFKGTSPLTDHAQTLHTYRDNEEMVELVGNKIETTFVPMRNAAFLMMAANRAAAEGAKTIITGVCEADNANYPDCREAFISSTEATINLALGREGDDRVLIQAPLMHLSKDQSVNLAMTTEHAYEALAYSHTAYDGVYPPCGKDHASILRAHGFEQAGVPDPLVLRAWMEGLMPLPATENYHFYNLRSAADKLSFLDEGFPKIPEQIKVDKSESRYDPADFPIFTPGLEEKN